MKEELSKIILIHKEKYPLMQIEDFVKLIFQNEFGGGHLIANKDSSLNYILKEYENTKSYSNSFDIEEIGNNIVRVPLCLIPKLNISFEEFNDAFVESSNTVQGNMQIFKEKLKVLQDITSQYEFNFTRIELDLFLENYINIGCPLISHSLLYKEAYHPSYRIIRKDKLADLTTCKKVKNIV